MRRALFVAGTDEYTFALAPHRPQAYQPSTRLVWPTAQDIPGAEGKVSGDPFVRIWHIDKWDSGEGEDLWERGFFNKSTNVEPKQVGDGLTLGAAISATTDDNASPATFTEGRRFGTGQGKLWAGRDATIHWWQPTTGDWDETGWTTGATDTITSIVDQGDGTNMLVGYDTTDAIKQVSSGANATVTGLTFSYAPVLRNWGGTLFYLDGDDLYEFTLSGAAATETLRADLTGRSDDYLTNGFEVYNRLSSSDKGPIWFQRLDNGQTFVWEWNVATQTTSRLAKLPTDWSTPYNIFFANGWYFVSFRYAASHAEAGEANIFVFRGAQKFVAGPFREATAGTTASRPILIAGVIGDDLIVFFDGAYWAYNLSTGGISMVADSAGSDHTKPTECITFGKSIFLANMSNAYQVERADRTSYSTRTATIDSGRFDFGYQGVQKAFLTVKVTTEPLGSGASVSLAYSVDGGSFTTVSGTHSNTNATSYTWTLSDSTASVVGEDLELRLTLAGTASVTPVIRSVSARAIGVEKQRTFRLEIDAGTATGGIDGAAPRAADVLADLRALAAFDGVVRFDNPFEVEDHDDPEQIDCVVTVTGLGDATPDISQEAGYVVIEAREVTYV